MYYDSRVSLVAGTRRYPLLGWRPHRFPYALEFRSPGFLTFTVFPLLLRRFTPYCCDCVIYSRDLARAVVPLSLPAGSCSIGFSACPVSSPAPSIPRYGLILLSPQPAPFGLSPAHWCTPQCPIICLRLTFRPLRLRSTPCHAVLPSCLLMPYWIPRLAPPPGLHHVPRPLSLDPSARLHTHPTSLSHPAFRTFSDQRGILHHTPSPLHAHVSSHVLRVGHPLSG